MQISTILPALAVALLGATNAAAIDGDIIEPRTPSSGQGIKLLTLKGVTRNPSSTYTGVGFPGQCQSLPSNINTFKDASSIIKCFQCEIYTGRGCTGNVFEVGASFDQPKGKSRGRRPQWKSWKCSCS